MKESLRDLWRIADVLAMRLYETPTGSISGKVRVPVEFEGLTLDVPLMVVSSCITQSGSLVLCRSMGNLALLVSTDFPIKDDVAVFILDVAKLPSRPEAFLERTRGVKNAKPYELILEASPAIVDVYLRTNEIGQTWCRGDLTECLGYGQQPSLI